MKMSRNIGGNSSSVSIWKAPAQKYGTDTNQDEKVQPTTVNLETLRALARLVQTIRAKIESEGRLFK